jgi:apolipoprotein N-acyltransferase
MMASPSTDEPAANRPGAARRRGPADDFLSRLDRLSTWQLRGAAFAIGALAAAALPPVHAVPLLAVSLGGLVLMIDRTAGWRQALALGWCFGLGHFAAGIYWVANALIAVSSNFGWLLPFAILGAVGGLSALLACFPAVAIAAARLLWPAGPTRILVLAVAWTVCEWLRAWVLTGFPWNLIGYSWAFSDDMIQLAALTGIWGLSFLAVAIASLPALLVDWTGIRSPGAGAGRNPAAAIACLAAGAAVLAGVWLGGNMRLSNAAVSTVSDVRLRLVQANIAPGEKSAADRGSDVLDRQVRLTVETPGFAAVTHAIWAETANPFPLERYPEARDVVAAAVPGEGLLITGVIRTEPATGAPRQIWNSMAAVDRTGRVLGGYDKFHLVPFGEYVPLHDVLPFVSKFTPGILDFSAGPGPRTLRLRGLPPVGPLICYEVIFPGEVVDPADRPEWLLNLTNDGWYGISSGPHQHFVSARLRAVEEGLPVVRAANTGISGVIDAYGRVLDRTRLGEAQVLDSALPRPPTGLTPYARWGDVVAAVLLAAVTVGAYVVSFVRRVT